MVKVWSVSRHRYYELTVAHGIVFRKIVQVAFLHPHHVIGLLLALSG